MDHNAELGNFLRARRAALSPQDAGVIPNGGVRRVPGLRRDEVAHLAGVSTDYYTRLEQGRHPNVSETVLDAVARALGLDEVERGYLFELGRARAARSPRRRPVRPKQVRRETYQMLDVLNDVSPAFIVDHRQDVLAANSLARALITDFNALPHRDRNFARYVLLDPAARDLYRDWENVAATVVATLRLFAGHHPDDSRLNELIGELCIKAPEFHTWWADHRVDQCAHKVQRFDHPVVGELTLRHERLIFPADPDQAVCLYTPEPGSVSADTLRLLASWSTPDRSTEARAPRTSEAARE